MKLIVNIDGVENNECINLSQLRKDSSGNLTMNEEDFKDFLLPYIKDILTTDVNLRKELGLDRIDVSEEETEDLKDLEELKRL